MYSHNTFHNPGTLIWRYELILSLGGFNIISFSRLSPRLVRTEINLAVARSPGRQSWTVPTNCTIAAMCSTAFDAIWTMLPRVGEPSPDEWMAFVNHLTLRNINCTLDNAAALVLWINIHAHCVCVYVPLSYASVYPFFTLAPVHVSLHEIIDETWNKLSSTFNHKSFKIMYQLFSNIIFSLNFTVFIFTIYIDYK